jgi:RNA polymerase sigma-70 factor (ECF subfamily)
LEQRNAELRNGIIIGMIEGDPNAFEKCYQLYSPAIYTAICKICQNRETACDLLHDTFIDAFENIEQFDTNNNFIAWLKRIAFNNSFNYLKKQNNTLKLVEQIANTEKIKPKSMASIATDNDLLTKLLANVPEKQRLILWLFIVEQYSHDEIALLVNQSASYSKSIVSRCLKQLREDVEENKDAYM